MAPPIPIWLPVLLQALATAVREQASHAPGQSVADTKGILKAAIPLIVKGRRTEFAAIEMAIRPAYPVGASVGRRARMLGATWTLRMALHIAEFVRHPEVLEAPEGVSYADIAALYDISPATLTRCLVLATDGEEGGPPPAAAVIDPTKRYRLSPDGKFMGWAHPMMAINQQHGVAWQGSGLTAVEVDPSCFAYPMNNVVGVARDTCLVKAHGAKDQGAGTLCPGCQSGKGCTERYVYAKGGIALMQGHVAGCETQVLAQLKSTFPGGVFDAACCSGLLAGQLAVPCCLTPAASGCCRADCYLGPRGPGRRQCWRLAAPLSLRLARGGAPLRIRWSAPCRRCALFLWSHLGGSQVRTACRCTRRMTTGPTSSFASSPRTPRRCPSKPCTWLTGCRGIPVGRRSGTRPPKARRIMSCLGISNEMFCFSSSSAGRRRGREEEEAGEGRSQRWWQWQRRRRT